MQMLNEFEELKKTDSTTPQLPYEVPAPNVGVSVKAPPEILTKNEIVSKTSLSLICQNSSVKSSLYLNHG